MSLSEASVSRPVTTSMFFVSLVVLGAISLYHLPLAFLPEVDIPFIWIEIPYRGANPAQIERTITRPLEEALSTMPGIQQLDSSSEPDGAWIMIRFDWGESISAVRLETDAKIASIRSSLPADLGQIMIYSFSTTDIPIVWGRLSAPGRDLSESYDLIEKRIKNRLERVEGVAKVGVYGVSPKEVRVHFKLEEILAHKVDVGDLIRSLDRASTGESLGTFRDAGQVLNLRTQPLFDSVNAVQEHWIGQKDLKVKDVAWVSYREPPLAEGRHLNTDFAIAFEVNKESTANTVEVADEVKRVIRDEIGTDPMLRGIELFVWQDQAEEITNALKGLRRAGLWGALFAVGVLFAFLRRPMATLIVSASIPISIIAACVCLYMLGKNLNVLSLMGLMLGVGMLVDNSIVVFESIFRRHASGVKAAPAAVSGAREVEVAVIAATLTTVTVFLPLLVGAKSELSVWLSEIGLTITLTLLCSLLVSLTLIPFLSSWLLKARPLKEPMVFQRLTDTYMGMLKWTFRHKRSMGLIVILGIPALLSLPFGIGLDTETFSGVKKNQVDIEYEFKDFFYLDDAEQAVNEVERYLFDRKKEFFIDAVYSYYTDNRARTLIMLGREDLDDRQYGDLVRRIRDDLPPIAGVQLRFTEDDEEDTSRTFAFRYYGEDPEVLDRLAARSVEMLKGVAGLDDLHVDQQAAREEIEAVVNRPKAQEAGLSPMTVAQVLGFSLGGARMSRLTTPEREVDLLCGLQYEDREDIEDLRKIPVGGGDGRSIPLGSIVDFRIVKEPTEIRRQDRRRVVAVKANYDGEEYGKTRGQIEEILDDIPLPLGYEWNWGGALREREDQMKEMQTNLILALLLVYLVIASLFESFSHPFSILFSIPFGLLGSVWFLLVTGTPFNLMSQIGFLILMGIVVNNGIVLIDKINRLRRAGVEREEAILQGGRERLRPILMTSFTTILGLMPMALGRSGVGDAYYFPLARTIIGGLLVSSVLTLLILPQIYVFFDSLGMRLRRIGQMSRASTP